MSNKQEISKIEDLKDEIIDLIVGKKGEIPDEIRYKMKSILQNVITILESDSQLLNDNNPLKIISFLKENGRFNIESYKMALMLLEEQKEEQRGIFNNTSNQLKKLKNLCPHIWSDDWIVDLGASYKKCLICGEHGHYY